MNDLLVKAPPLTRPYLESLTTHELRKLADSFGIDIPPDLERVFIISELLDLTLEDGPEEAEFGKDDDGFFMDALIPEPVSLPKQYNITFIEVLIRDPLWAFSFWEIKSHDREIHEKSSDFGGYYLKVSPVSPSGASSPEDSFIIPVGLGDTAWYIGFPPKDGRFKVDLCALRGEEELSLASSRPFTLPRLCRRKPPEMSPPADFSNNPLGRLSGAEDFHVLRSGDRRSRIKGASDS